MEMAIKKPLMESPGAENAELVAHQYALAPGVVGIVIVVLICGRVHHLSILIDDRVG